MDTRFYQSPYLDIGRIAQELENVFVAQGYQTQQFGDRRQMVVQLRKGSDLEAIIGMQAALTVTLQSAPDGVMAVVGQQQWIDKAAVGIVGLLLVWPLAVTTGLGVFRQVELENRVYNTLDGVVRRLRNDVKVGPIPEHMQHQKQHEGIHIPFFEQTPPPWQANWQPNVPPQDQGPTAAGTLACPNCGESNEVGDTYCYRCGKPLAPQKQTCPQCHADVKANAAFCSKCGTPVAP